MAFRVGEYIAFASCALNDHLYITE